MIDTQDKVAQEQTVAEVVIVDAPSITAYAQQAKNSIHGIMKRWSELHTAASQVVDKNRQSEPDMEAFAESQLILSEKIAMTLVELNANLALLSLNLAHVFGERKKDVRS